MKDYYEEIIGYEDIKKELSIISDMLNKPEIYKALGAEMESGLILNGRPGTGKTTMANCLIRSTKRKSYVIRKKVSDGEFIKTIADTFEEAKKNAPSIVLLDDLDKFSDEDRDCDAEEFVTVQTCIDEIKGKDVFVIATVNRICKIPDSLLRAGRLGKRLHIRVPKKEEAVAVIKHYLDKAGISEGIEEESIARMLDGESCATLKDVINNAAIKAGFNRQSTVTMQNIVDACLDLVFEAPDSGDQLPEDIKKRIAYHEAGHATVAELLDPGSVSIVSIRKTDEGDYGFIRYSRSDDLINTSSEYNEGILKTSLGGRAASEVVFGETDMGAVVDLDHAFSKAKTLADDKCMYGFQNWVVDDRDVCGNENRNRTVTVILERNYLEVKKLLIQNRDFLDKIADELFKKTTLVYSDLQEICALFR